MTKQELRLKMKDFTYVKADEIDLSEVSLLLAFHPMKSEVDITPIIDQAKRNNIKVVFPDKDPYKFDDVIISEIYEKAIMLVPGLAFTKQGFRLGRGMGFYDRTLSVLPSCVKTIGICKKSQIVETMIVEEHDMKVSEVLSF